MQPTATWLQVHMQFMFLSLFTFFFCLFFFPCHPSARPLIHLQRPFSAVWRSPFAAGKVLVLTMSISLAFPLPRLSCCFGREVVTYWIFLPQFFQFLYVLGCWSASSQITKVNLTSKISIKFKANSLRYNLK